MLTVASMLMIGVAVNAQSDSTYKSESKTSTYSQKQSHSPSYDANDRQIVQSSDLPESMRKTLNNSRYAGWENSTIYRDNASNDYYFDLKNGNSSTEYRFDQKGNTIQGTAHQNKSTTMSKKTSKSTLNKSHKSSESSK